MRKIKRVLEEIVTGIAILVLGLVYSFAYIIGYVIRRPRKKDS
jgi:hypothetical protein